MSSGDPNKTSPSSSKRFPVCDQAHASLPALVKDDFQAENEELKSLYESAEKALTLHDRSLVDTLMFQISDRLEILREKYSQKIQSLPNGEQRDWLKLQRKAMIANFEEFEVHVEQVFEKLPKNSSAADQLINAELIMSRPASFEAMNRCPGSSNHSRSKSSKSHGSCSTTPSQRELRKAKIARRMAEINFAAVEQKIKLEAQQQVFKAELELRKAVAVDEVLNENLSHSCETSTSHNDRNSESKHPMSRHRDQLQHNRSPAVNPINNPSDSNRKLGPRLDPDNLSAPPQWNKHSGEPSLLATLTEQMFMPRMECPKFNGNPEDYCAFIGFFEENVHKRVSFTDQQKLALLLQSTTDDAHSAISHCPSLHPASKGYEEARQVLFENFGDPRIIAESFKKGLLQRGRVKPNDAVAMSSFANALRKSLVTLENIGDCSELNSGECLKMLSDKLPHAVCSGWRRQYATIYTQERRKPIFSDFVAYVKKEADISKAFPEQFLSSDSSVTRQRVNKDSAQKSVCAATALSCPANFSKKPPLPQSKKCYYCSKLEHSIYKCADFKALTVPEREEFVVKSQRCYICFGKHTTKDHRGPFRCRIGNCGQRHNRLLHLNLPEPDHPPSVNELANSNNAASDQACYCVNKTQRGFRLIVPVKAQANGVAVDTYAFLDSGSEVSFCDSSLFEQLKIKPKPCPVKIITMSQSSQLFDKFFVDLNISSLTDSSVTFKIREIVKAKTLPIAPNAVISSQSMSSLTHLQGINIPILANTRVSLLIGSDCPSAHKILQMREGNGTQPNAVMTHFGWSLFGPAIARDADSVHSHFVESDEVLDQAIRKSWFTEFEPDAISVPSSKEDREVISLLKSGVHHKDGHFYAPLPWRSNVTLPANSYAMASKRLSSLRKRFQRDSHMMEKYKEKIEAYLFDGYMERVPEDEITKGDAAWYLPHHPVCNPKKPGKLRVVFDCAAKHYGICLNDALKQGPDLVNDLVGVLSRFRRKRIAIVADIQAMFHQVRVQNADRDAFRLLWWPGGNIHEQPVPYRMLVHIFGATSSPCIATYCLRQTATQFGSDFNSHTCEVIQRDFYVDDCLTCVNTVDEAKHLINELRHLLKAGGFNLTKWLSNVPEVIESVSAEDRATFGQDINREIGRTTIQRVLGVGWNVNRDEFYFNVIVPSVEESYTRRTILSCINSLYDPLGFVAPVILTARIMQQRIVQLGINWDDEFTDEMTDSWRAWFGQLGDLESFSLPRCLLPDNMGEVIQYQIHHFSDASVSGYGFVSYLRSKKQKWRCTL